eukprot:765130-Hanusia_phi.AAC.3
MVDDIDAWISNMSEALENFDSLEKGNNNSDSEKVSGHPAKGHHETLFLKKFCEVIESSNNLVSDLESKGYCVLDDCFQPEFLRHLVHEIDMLRDCCAMEPSPNILQGNDGEDLVLTKEGVLEKSIVIQNEIIMGEGTLSFIPNLRQLCDCRSQMVSALQSKGGILSKVTALDQAKVTYITKDGAFPVHVDSHPVYDRMLTITLYLNEGYRDEDAGELRLFPLPYQPLDIKPKFGRIVLFSSIHVYHRVMPSQGHGRYTLALWFTGTDSSFPKYCFDPKDPRSDLEPDIFPNRDSLPFLVYYEDCKQSIRESFNGNEKDKLESALIAFERKVQDYKERLGSSLLQKFAALPLGFHQPGSENSTLSL